MHELSLAKGILDVVEDCARENDCARISRIRVRVGEFAAVMPDAMTTAFSIIAQGTVAEGAELVLEDVPAVGRCRACGREYGLTENEYTCPCGAAGGFDFVRKRDNMLSKHIKDSYVHFRQLRCTE